MAYVHAMAVRERILMLDSGLGGLTVFREVLATRPHADYVYVADDASFPYGGLDESVLVARLVKLMGELIDAHRPDLIVIPCNTASTIVLPDLRKTFSVPFVGTVPAIKPACAASVTRRVSVFGTEATVAREYTRALIRDYAGDCKITLVGSKHLAAYAEAELAGAPVADAAIVAELAPCFVDDGRRWVDVIHRPGRNGAHHLYLRAYAAGGADPLRYTFRRRTRPERCRLTAASLTLPGFPPRNRALRGPKRPA